MALKAAADNNRVAIAVADTGRLVFSWPAPVPGKSCAIGSTIFFIWAISSRQPSTVGQ